jgi:hypothetical protein
VNWIISEVRSKKNIIHGMSVANEGDDISIFYKRHLSVLQKSSASILKVRYADTYEIRTNEKRLQKFFVK